MSTQLLVAQREDTTSRVGAYQAAIRAFGEVSAAFVDARALDDVLHLIARQVCALVGVTRCSVYLRDDSTGLFRGQVAHAESDIDARVKVLVAGMAADGFTGEIMATKAPVVVFDALHDPRPMRAAVRNFNIRSMLGVPMLLDDEVIGLLFLDDEHRPHVFTTLDQEVATAFAGLAAVAVSQFQLNAKLRASVDTVARQNELLRRSAALDERLTNLVLEGGSLREIAQAVTALTAKPCAVYDARGRRLVAERPLALTEDVFPQLLEDPWRSRPAVAAALAALDPTRAGKIGPLPQADLAHRYVVAPVRVRGECWGRFVLMEYPGRFGLLDVQVCRLAATNIALEMSAERRAATAHREARAALAADLVRGGADLARLQRRADHVGVTLDTPRVVALVRARDREEDVADLLRRVSAELAPALACDVTAGCALLLDLDRGLAPSAAVASARERVERACREVDHEGSLVAGVSAVCAEAGGYPRAYEEAREVVEAVAAFSAHGAAPVLSMDDLGPGRLLLTAGSRAQAERFAAETLGPLLEDRHATLLETLASFVERGLNVREAASDLGVHDNTVRYRVARAEELTARSLDDPRAQLAVHMALLVLRLSGRLP